MSGSTIFYALLAFVIATAVLFVVRDGARSRERLDRRVMWMPVGAVVWAMGSNQFASVSQNPCVTGNTGETFKGAITYQYLDCSRDLLSGGGIDVSLFVWTWLPPMIAAVVGARYLVHVVAEIRGRKAGSR